MALPHFSLPTIVDNKDGWGPVAEGDILTQEGIPFAPFNKNDKLGRITDFSASSNKRGRQGRYQQQFGVGTGQFQYKHEDDESSFSLVDNRPKPKQKFGRKPFRPQWNNNRWNNNNRNRWNNKNQKNRWGNKNNSRWGNRGRWNNWNDRVQDIKDPSVEIQESWKLLDTLEFSTLEKSRSRLSKPAEDITDAGRLHKFDPDYQNVTPLLHKRLQRFESTQHFTASTSDDPVIQRLADEKRGNVYATDTILAVLMAAPRSVLSWDLVVRKENGAIFIDKRPDSKIDFLSVNENWHESQQTDKENINHPANLSREATLINHNFSQQVFIKEGGYRCSEKNPFQSGLEKGMVAAHDAYYYRQFEFEGGIKLVARCSISGVIKKGKEKKKMVVRALNEFDPKLSGNVDWRTKLEAQTGSVLATEMKNNAAKLSRWTAETTLSGADELRLGFVSRNNFKDAFKHSILMCKRYDPKAFAAQLNISLSNQWGVLKTVLDALKAQDDGSFLILKDPNKAELQLYSVPADAFAHEDQE